MFTVINNYNITIIIIVSIRNPFLLLNNGASACIMVYILFLNAPHIADSMFFFYIYVCICVPVLV